MGEQKNIWINFKVLCKIWTILEIRMAYLWLRSISWVILRTKTIVLQKKLWKMDDRKTYADCLIKIIIRSISVEKLRNVTGGGR